jgi:hypothetical protein
MRFFLGCIMDGGDTPLRKKDKTSHEIFFWGVIMDGGRNSRDLLLRPNAFANKRKG